MTDARAHRLAERALERMASGADPIECVVSAIVAYTGRTPLPAIYDGLPRRSRALCLAMYGELPLTPKDLHGLVGGSYKAIYELLRRLVYHGFAIRTAYGRYTLPPPELAPARLPSISHITPIALRAS